MSASKAKRGPAGALGASAVWSRELGHATGWKGTIRLGKQLIAERAVATRDTVMMETDELRVDCAPHHPLSDGAQHLLAPIRLGRLA